ncbi:MAG TPA: isoprenylcysteine carboxylmethyltransferase family protein [Opitutaceae bacterium]|nr:isoprenylcysteine carboxylmethyltransferase family protein [Opitutaceae bacterium]
MSFLRLKIPPVAVFLVVGALMRQAAVQLPQLAIEIPGRIPLAIALAAFGIVFAWLGGLRFVRVRTTIHPMHPEQASTLVTSGIFGVSRNPMYLGLLLILAAWGIHLASALALFGLPAFALYLNEFQIKPEEEALARKFGAAYEEYQQRVRRWF